MKTDTTTTRYIDNPLELGKYSLCQIKVKEGAKPPYHDADHIMIRHESGEAMSVPIKTMEVLIDKFYGENF